MKTPAFLLFLFAIAVCRGDWPQFRGLSGTGTTDESDLPLTWNGETGENIVWRAPLPKSDNAYSSPIVAGGRVFVTCATNDPITHRVLCFAAADGRQLWERAVEPGPLVLTDLRGGYGAPTPCAAGGRVFVVFGSAVLAALDFEGKILWRKEIANHAFDVALGSSPIPFKDTIILDCDQTGQTSSIIAFDQASGKIRWDAKRPDTGFAHSTPVIVEIAGRPQMLVSASGAIQGIDPENGTILWWCAAQGDASSPAFASGLVFSDSGRGGKAVCVDPTGAGDVTGTHLKWTFPQIPEGLSSAVIATARVWRTHNPEILKCIRLDTGKLEFQERLPGISTWASPFTTPDGRIYFASAGRSYVLRAGPKLEVLATNEIGDESRASAAVSDGRIFLRGQKNLYCIGKK
ncbi:MAG: PQQ-binding-like beta-propeller repeat protein [Chthoniobacteraceae bacterium]